MIRTYFVVEGPHDVEVIGRLLRRRDLRRIRQLEKLEPYWHPLVPKSYPPDGDLQKRVPVPVFFAGGGRSIAVQSAGGINKIGTYTQVALINLDTEPDAVGILLDADERGPIETWKQLSDKLTTVSLGTGPGDVAQGPPRAGAFVLPDNEANGTLENLLLECASKTYPGLLREAQMWVDGIDTETRPSLSVSR
ncbi:MAG: DUF3226 domain-containing protein [Myxococcota bacterium]